MILNDFPKLREAILMIAHDNGCINREEADRDLIKECEMSLLFGVISCRDELMLAEQDLASLSDDDFQLFCIGPENEQDAIQLLAKISPRTVTLLNHFYDVVTE